MDWLVTIGVITGMYLLGKYAIEEGQRTERQKEFEKNLKNWGKKKK